MMSDAAGKVLEAQFTVELSALANESVCLRLPFLDAWIMLMQIQIAQSSRLNDPASAGLAEEIGRELQAVVTPTPALEVMAEKGWEMGAREVPCVALQLFDIAIVGRLCRAAGKVLTHRLLPPDDAAELREVIEVAERMVGRWTAEMETLEL